MFARGVRLLLCILIFLLFSFFTKSDELQDPKVKELAQQLIAAKTENDRLQILEANTEKINKELSLALVATGDRLRSSVDYFNSKVAYELAVLVSEKIHYTSGKAAGLTGIGRIYSSQAKYDLAMKYFQQALELSDIAKDYALKADILRRIGTIHNVHGQDHEEMELLKESLKLEESIHNPKGIAETLQSIAWRVMDQGNLEEAYDYLKTALRYAQESGDSDTLGGVYNALGGYYESRGDLDSALSNMIQAKNLSQEAGNLPFFSNTLHNIANLHSAKGNYVAALQFHLDSLKIREKLKSKRAVAISLKEIGALYTAQGNLTLALEYLNRSYNSIVDANDPYWTAAILRDLGTVYTLSGNPDKAISFFEKSLAIHRKIESETDIADTLSSMGRTYVILRQFDKALECYQKAMDVIKKFPDARSEAAIIEGMAWTEIELGNYQQALRLSEKATELSRNNDLPELLWSALLTKGKCHMALQHHEMAISSLDESIQVLERLREHVAGGEEQKEDYLEKRTEPYATMIELLIGQNKRNEALQFAERAKARVLLDVMQKGHLDVSRVLTPEEKKEEARLKENLYILNVKFRESISSGNAELASVETLKKELEKTRLENEAFRAKLYAVHPELKIQRAETEILDLSKARALIPDDKTLFMEYVVSGNKTFLFCLSLTEIEMYEIELTEKKLHETVSTFRKQIAKRDPGFRNTAKQLYQILVEPAKLQINHSENIIIIPDGTLWELPFQALLTKNGRFFLEDAAISYAPSITALGEMQKIRQNRSSNPTVLAFANPSLGNETAEKVQMVFRDAQLHPLPESEIEVKKLVEIYGSESTSTYFGPDAKESVLKRKISKYGIIHLATHGILNETSPMYSHLLFSRSGDTDPEDGLLEAWEIMNMNLTAHLAILSACDTARGRIGAGEGVIGLNWAFFIAGCPTTVVSQWKVESSSTADLMFRFHQNLKKEKTSRSQALREAALSILKNPDYRHPFYWASFIVVGDPN